MKLELELVPSTAFYSNIRKIVSETDWKKISKTIRRLHNNKCQLCGSIEKPYRKYYMHCHEVWDFDYETKKQSLVKLECLCPECHSIKHYCHSINIGISEKELVSHACKVNNCNIATFKDHIAIAFVAWQVKSTIEYSFDKNKALETIATFIKELETSKK